MKLQNLDSRPYILKWSNENDKGYIEYSNGYIELWDYIGTTSPVSSKFIEFPYGIKLKPNYGVSSSPYDNAEGGRNISIRSDFIGNGVFFSTTSGSSGSASLVFYRVCGFKR
ncbi:MAG: hypothetical protein ACRCXX_12815 [Cetobacterium sp.]|uniref:hypothetical protein n=1 Tax=Cetobacterium sp. TaxID=2071632 RepID=UPI003F31D9F2